MHDGYISAMQQCYSVASAQRRSRTAEGALAQSSAEDGQQGVSLHLEDGVPVYQDMSINMQVRPPTAPLLIHLSERKVHAHLRVAQWQSWALALCIALFWLQALLPEGEKHHSVL